MLRDEWVFGGDLALEKGQMLQQKGERGGERVRRVIEKLKKKKRNEFQRFTKRTSHEEVPSR